jgi:hypothetical protein
MSRAYGRTVLAAAIGLIVPAVLLFLGVPRLVEGIGAERALPAVNAGISGDRLPLERWRYAADDLASTMPENGDGLVRRAEMTFLAANGNTSGLAQARSEVIEGLTLAPTNPRGWTLLCEIDARIAPTEAAHCMDTGFFVAPFDWFVAGRRALLAADLWPRLDADVQEAAARRVRLMWESDHWDDHRVKFALLDVYRAPNGAALLTAGFHNDREELREFNRWVIREIMYGPMK